MFCSWEKLTRKIHYCSLTKRILGSQCIYFPMPESGMSVSSLGSRNRDSTTTKCFASNYCFSKCVVCFRIRAYLELRLKIELLSKKEFWAKASFSNFCQKCILAIFRFFRPLKVLFNFFLPNEYFFIQMDFLSVKSTFKPLKRNPKHALKKLSLSLAMDFLWI